MTTYYDHLADTVAKGQTLCVEHLERLDEETAANLLDISYKQEEVLQDTISDCLNKLARLRASRESLEIRYHELLYPEQPSESVDSEAEEA